MKVSNFTAQSASGIKIFKPVQYLFVEGVANNGMKNVKMRARLVNSESGRVDEIIPLVGLDVLGEITSMNEGFFVKCDYEDGKDNFAVNVMLHPTSAVYLSNDRYLEVDIEGLSDAEETTIYGIEMPVIDKEFICRYNKFYMSAGELQKTFTIGENENLILPDESFEEVTLHYKNGSSCTYTNKELQAMMMLKNDIVSVPKLKCDYVVGTAFQAVYEETRYCFGSADMYGLDVADVETISIRREAASKAFEFILIDTIKE